MNQQLITESSFRRFLVTGLFWPVFLVAAYCGALFLQASANYRARDQLALYESRHSVAEQVKIEMLNMETGLRGYLLNDPDYLGPYESGKSRINSDLTNLVRLSSKDEPERTLAKRTVEDSNAWMREAKICVDLRSQGTRPSNDQLDKAKSDFDRIRKDLDAYISGEAFRIGQSQANIVLLIARITWIAIGGALIVATLLAMIMTAHLRQISSFYHHALEANESKAAEIERINRELEERVEQRTSELTNANKELEAFSYSVSHDLRAPLRSIASFSMILQEDLHGKLDADSVDNLSRIRQAAAKMTQLIDALLRFSRIARANLTKTEVDVTELVNSVIAEIERESKEPVQHNVQPGMTAQADSHLLRVVFENLLENAWKFSSKKEHPQVQVGFESGTFFVKDNGAGFESEFVHKVFIPFERLHTDREFPGTGIGLATAKRIIDRHGGKIWAEGKVGEGATFYFTLGPST